MKMIILQYIKITYVKYSDIEIYLQIENNFNKISEIELCLYILNRILTQYLIKQFQESNSWINFV